MEPTAGRSHHPALERLRDIHGIDGVPWWPLAPGWWVLASVLILLACLAWHWRAILRLRIPIPGITLGDLALGRRRRCAICAAASARRAGAKTPPGELSELLRRIAMARLGRPACAGLTGTDWLAWLASPRPQRLSLAERGTAAARRPLCPRQGAGFRPGTAARRTSLP